jgi:choloylglycine hydrolase
VIGILTTLAACTTFLVQDGDRVAVGKSYDWNMGQGIVLANKRGVKKRALLFDPRERAAEWTSKHASLTFNQYGREMPNGGINDAGLVLEIMWLDDSIYPPKDQRPAVNELQWIQYQLDSFATVKEVVAHAGDLRVSPANGRVHYLACDATAACAALEHLGGKLVVSEGAKTLTNHPYEASQRYLEKRRGKVPDSSSSLDRFVRASHLATQRSEQPIVPRAFAILDSVRSPGYSKWNIVYEPKLKRVHYRTQDASEIKTVSLDSFDASCSAGVQMLDLDADVEGEVAARFAAYDPSLNLKLVKRSLASIEKTLPEGALQMVADYPGSTTCQPR